MVKLVPLPPVTLLVCAETRGAVLNNAASKIVNRVANHLLSLISRFIDLQGVVYAIDPPKAIIRRGHQSCGVVRRRRMLIEVTPATMHALAQGQEWLAHYHGMASR